MGYEITLTIGGDDAHRLMRRAEDLDMNPTEYVSFALVVAESMPDSLLFALAAGVPVTFAARATLGECPDE